MTGAYIALHGTLIELFHPCQLFESQFCDYGDYLGISYPS